MEQQTPVPAHLVTALKELAIELARGNHHTLGRLKIGSSQLSFFTRDHLEALAEWAKRQP